MDLSIRHCDLLGGDRGEFMVTERQCGEPLFWQRDGRLVRAIETLRHLEGCFVVLRANKSADLPAFFMPENVLDKLSPPNISK
jgi:hypothetical protein